MSKITTLLFDVDGTLVDSNELHIKAWDRALREFGHRFSHEELHAQVGKGGDNYVPALLPKLDPAAQQAIADRHGDIYKGEYLEQVQAFPGARDLVARTRAAGLNAVLASSASAEEIDHYLDLLDLRDLLDGVTGKDDVESSKPDPDIFQAALDKVEARPDEALVIGDTPHDVTAAKRCGVGTVAVLSGGFTEGELREAGAMAIYRDAADLLAQFDRSPLAKGR